LCEENVWDSNIHSIEIYLGQTLVITLKDFHSKIPEIQDISVVEVEEYLNEPNLEMIQLLPIKND
jgi:hypothetical protein